MKRELKYQQKGQKQRGDILENVVYQPCLRIWHQKCQKNFSTLFAPSGWYTEIS